MAWEKTREIGCGIAHCPDDKCGIISCGMTLVVCNYYPPGNYIDQRVYISGAPCSETSGCVNTPASTCNTSSNLCEQFGGLEFPPVLTTTVAPPNSGKCTAQLKSCTRGSCNCGCTINGGVNTDTSNSTCKAWVTKCTDNSCGCNCSTGSG
ncbi:peptidase inhibitor 16 [Ditylenchus destructor]|nr:peptidase inhibitor 16 [Ditylenchus destructor]